MLQQNKNAFVAIDRGVFILVQLRLLSDVLRVKYKELLPGAPFCYAERIYFKINFAVAYTVNPNYARQQTENISGQIRNLHYQQRFLYRIFRPDEEIT